MKKIFFVLIAVAFIFSACQQKEEAKTEVPAETVKSEVVEIIDPWIRPSASGTNTALFLGFITTLAKPILYMMPLQRWQKS